MAKRADHLLPEGRRWPPKGQQKVLLQRHQITYQLRAGNGHQRVNRRFCCKVTRSLTLWGQEMATKGSAEGFAPKRTDHLLPEGRKWPPKGQQQVLPQRDQTTHSLGRKWPPKGQQKVLLHIDQITHSLRAGNSHQRINRRFCCKVTRSLTL